MSAPNLIITRVRNGFVVRDGAAGPLIEPHLWVFADVAELAVGITEILESQPTKP